MTARGASRLRARGLPLPVGTYHYDVRLDRWDVSPSARAIVGLSRSGSIGTADVLGLVPADEAEAGLVFVREALESHAPFSFHHRVGGHAECEVVVVGEGEEDAEGALLAVHGQVVDVGRVSAERVNAELDEKVAEVVAHRATIEQAKGALILAHGFDEDAAIALLRWWSSHRNVKVHTLAGQLVKTASSRAVGTPALRATLDDILSSRQRLSPDGQPS